MTSPEKQLTRAPSPLQGLTSLAVILVVLFQVLSAFMVSYWWKHGPKPAIETVSLPQDRVAVVSPSLGPDGKASPPGQTQADVVGGSSPDASVSTSDQPSIVSVGDPRPAGGTLAPDAPPAGNSDPGTTAAGEAEAAEPAPSSLPNIVADRQVEKLDVPKLPQVPMLPSPSLDALRKAEDEERLRKLAEHKPSTTEMTRPAMLPPLKPNLPVNVPPLLTPTTPENAGLPPPLETSSPDISKWMKLAADRAKEGNTEEAKRLLLKVQQVDPKYHPAYANRAGLFERQGDFQSAKEQWQRALEMARDNRQKSQSMQQISRLDRKIQKLVGVERTRQQMEDSRNQSQELAAIQNGTASMPASVKARPERSADQAPKLPEVTRRPNSLRIRPEVGSVVSKRLVGDSANEDRREISLWLLADRQYGLVDLNSIGIRYCFFDRDVNFPGEVHIAHARPIQRLALEMDHANPNYYRIKLTLKYLIPKGTRTWEQSRDKPRKLDYYGFLLKVYYDGVLQANDFPVVRPTRVDHEIFEDKYLTTVQAVSR